MECWCHGLKIIATSKKKTKNDSLIFFETGMGPYIEGLLIPQRLSSSRFQRLVALVVGEGWAGLGSKN